MSRLLHMRNQYHSKEDLIDPIIVSTTQTMVKAWAVTHMKWKLKTHFQAEISPKQGHPHHWWGPEYEIKDVQLCGPRFMSQQRH